MPEEGQQRNMLEQVRYCSYTVCASVYVCMHVFGVWGVRGGGSWECEGGGEGGEGVSVHGCIHVPYLGLGIPLSCQIPSEPVQSLPSGS